MTMVGLTRYVVEFQELQELQDLQQFACWAGLSVIWIVWILLSRIGFICIVIESGEKKDVELQNSSVT